MMDVSAILRVCGISNYLHIGDGQHTLIFDLLARSLDAYGIESSQALVSKNLERAPGRYFQGSLNNFPFTSETFDTVIIGSELLSIPETELAVVFQLLYQITKRNLILYFPIDVLKAISKNHTKRIFWEQLALEAGFRRHPRSILLLNYAELEKEEITRLSFFERVPSSALKKFPNAAFYANPQAYTDMLRESGRHADARLARYILASSRVRSGTILDIGCGLGYGSAVLASSHANVHCIGVDENAEAIAYAEANYGVTDKLLSYQVCSLSDLSFLPNHSIDTVIAFDILSKIDDYDVFLTEVSRVLKPDGCFWGSVPNLWEEDESKTNHVFDWMKLKKIISQYFIIDGRWAQSAGDKFKAGFSKRHLKKIPLDHSVPLDAEWWIFSANVDPRDAIELPYSKSFHKEDKVLQPRHIQFEKYYENPWLYRLIINHNERFLDDNILSMFCAQVAKQAKPGSADHGAALCVIAYKLLESQHVTLNAVSILANHIDQYDRAYNRNNHHAHRWSVSLHYVCGRLLLSLGHRDEALASFMTCVKTHPTSLDPIVVTMLISAHLHAGLIFVGSDALDKAREQFILGIKEAHRVFQGDWSNILGQFDNPSSLGLSEAVEVLNSANQCAEALSALDRHSSVPGFLWDKINLKFTDFAK